MIFLHECVKFKRIETIFKIRNRGFGVGCFALCVLRCLGRGECRRDDKSKIVNPAKARINIQSNIITHQSYQSHQCAVNRTLIIMIIMIGTDFYEFFNLSQPIHWFKSVT